MAEMPAAKQPLRYTCAFSITITRSDGSSSRASTAATQPAAPPPMISKSQSSSTEFELI
jgi:hypothetical protein